MVCAGQHAVCESQRIAPPWEESRFGVVSLLDMLNYAAADFFVISSTLGKLAMWPALMNDGKNSVQLGNDLGILLRHATKLKLTLSKNQIMAIDRFVRDGNTDLSSFASMVNELIRRVHEELDARVFFSLTAEETEYFSPAWLVGTPIQDGFPTAFNELQAAGRCYAFGECTASAFHVQRALEVALKALAVYLDKPFHRNSWDAHLKDIDKALEARKSAAGSRTKDEEFYSEAATQLGNMKVSWRNPTMHVDKKYDNKEAKRLLDSVEAFMLHLAKRGLKEAAE